MSPEHHIDLPELRQALQAASSYRPDPTRSPVVLALPFEGTWLAVNSPVRRVPSHRTHFLGQTYAIDFVPIDARDRTAHTINWRSVVASEPAERFVGFGQAVLAPAGGRVLVSHDGEPDHVARRSPVSVAGYLATQGSRLRRGLHAVLGNHVILGLGETGPYVALVHLRQGSVAVGVGAEVSRGQVLGACGNSGNSTQPHLHIQVMDSLELLYARGVPMVFEGYRARSRGESTPRIVRRGMPAHRERVEPLAAPPDHADGSAL